MGRELLIRDVRVFDGTSVVPRASVVVAQGRIEAVEERELTPAPDAEVVDGRGRTLLPGLIDAHVHVFPGSLEQALVFGVTTELDMLADPVQIAGLRAAATSRHDMADVRSAGTGATVPGGYPWYLVEQGYVPPFPTLAAPTEEADAFVRERIAEGSDYIKILIEDGSVSALPTPTLTAADVGALVAAAHAHDRLAVAHVLTAQAAEAAVAAGVDVLAHLFVDRPAAASTLAEIVDRGVVVVPTLSVLHALFGTLHGEELLADPAVAPYLDDQSRFFLAMGCVLGPDAHRGVAVATETLRHLHAAGVTLLAGTDAGNADTAHGASLHWELRLLVDAGLTPVEALTAATAAPAQVFGLSDRGRIAPGLRADLLLVDGDPTEEIAATKDIVAVWRGGRPVAREQFRRAQLSQSLS